jgi:hypothetical protein
MTKNLLNHRIDLVRGGRQHPPITEMLLNQNVPTSRSRGAIGLVSRWIAQGERIERPLSLSVNTFPSDPAVIEMYAEAGPDRVLPWLRSTRLGPSPPELAEWESTIAKFQGSS